jgi:hypothetical protein
MKISQSQLELMHKHTLNNTTSYGYFDNMTMCAVKSKPQENAIEICHLREAFQENRLVVYIRPERKKWYEKILAEVAITIISKSLELLMNYIFG